MKRGTPRHPKVQDLMERLSIPLYAACGLLELLWHFTAEYARQGDIGKFTDAAIAKACGWTGDASAFIEALIATRWLDESQEHRLLVHDWPEHAEDAVHMALGRACLLFAHGERPKLGKLAQREREAAEAAYLECANKVCEQGVRTPCVVAKPCHSHSQAQPSPTTGEAAHRTYEDGRQTSGPPITDPERALGVADSDARSRAAAWLTKEMPDRLASANVRKLAELIGRLGFAAATRLVLELRTAADPIAAAVMASWQNAKADATKGKRDREISEALKNI